MNACPSCGHEAPHAVKCWVCDQECGYDPIHQNVLASRLEDLQQLRRRAVRWAWRWRRAAREEGVLWPW